MHRLKLHCDDGIIERWEGSVGCFRICRGRSKKCMFWAEILPLALADLSTVLVLIVLDCSVICCAFVHTNFYGCLLSKAAGYLSLEMLECCMDQLHFLLLKHCASWACYCVDTEVKCLRNGLYQTKTEQNNSGVSQIETDQREANWIIPFQAQILGLKEKYYNMLFFFLKLHKQKVASPEQKLSGG